MQHLPTYVCSFAGAAQTSKRCVCVCSYKAVVCFRLKISQIISLAPNYIVVVTRHGDKLSNSPAP